MRTHFYVLVLLGLLMAGTASAEMIVFSDGTSINGKVLDQSGKKLKVEYNGQTVTYYADQIKTIDGKPFEIEKPKTEDKALEKKETKAPPEEITSLEQVYKAGVEKKKLSMSKNKKEAVRKFIEVTGVKEQMGKGFEQILANLPPESREKMRKVLNVDDIVANLMPVYDKHFTQEELDYYIWFYSSEAGQKLFKMLPVILQESAEVSTQYLEKRVPRDLK